MRQSSAMRVTSPSQPCLSFSVSFGPRPAAQGGGCPYSYRSSGDHCIPSKNSRMPSSAPVTPAPMGIGSQASTASPIRPSRLEAITKQGFRSISVVIKNLVVGLAAAGCHGDASRLLSTSLATQRRLRNKSPFWGGNRLGFNDIDCRASSTDDFNNKQLRTFLIF